MTSKDSASYRHLVSSTPLSCYQKALKDNEISADSSQAKAVEMLQALFESITSDENRKQYSPGPKNDLSRKKSRGVLGKMRRKLVRSEEPTASLSEPTVKGLYFWGGVGRGKTYLMDIFFDCLPGDRKLRIHFHRFMRRVHSDLKTLQGKQDPLKAIGRQLAEEVDVICFDEFFVTDITDAMILAGVLEAVFNEGVLLITTSNIPPEDLYKDGLQRERFLPAIALLHRYQEVFNLDGGTDYRLRALERAEIYHYPLDVAAKRSLETSFFSLAPETRQEAVSIDIEGRAIATVWSADGIVWCDFDALCDGPRSQNDYIELARIYSTVLVDGVPQFDGRNDDQARRFINLVDEFYDRNVKLIISAETDIHELYLKGQLTFEFERTISRLLEMQSHDYLEKPHIP